MVKAADVRDAHLRDQAMRAAQSACLNTAEGAARVTRADKARAFTIARGECVEAAAAIEIAALCGTAKQADSDRVAVIANALVAMLDRDSFAEPRRHRRLWLTAGASRASP